MDFLYGRILKYISLIQVKWEVVFNASFSYMQEVKNDKLYLMQVLLSYKKLLVSHSQFLHVSK